jgi:RNA polymerase sigma-70 factor (ECF subfamily)
MLAMDDALLVARIKAGEADAFEQVVYRYQRRLANYLYHIVGNWELALDLTQDTLLVAHRKILDTTSDLSLAAWLYRIALNHARAALRRRRLIAWVPLLEDLLDYRPCVEGPEVRSVEFDSVQRALAELPPGYRATLLLHDLEGFTCAEIAAILDIRADAVRKRLSRGRDLFRAAYAHQQEEGER